MQKMVLWLAALLALAFIFMIVIRPFNPPASLAPTANPSPALDTITPTPITTELITVASPLPGDKVSSPLVVTGLARGNWYFEATFPVELVDDKGQVLAKSFATAQADWMTENWVPFTAELLFDHGSNVTSGELILRKANASGLPEHDDEVSIQVKF